MNAIEQLRKKQKMTQEKLAVQIGVERSTVTKWESGAAMPTADKLPKIAKILNCSIDDLFKGL